MNPTWAHQKAWLTRAARLIVRAAEALVRAVVRFAVSILAAHAAVLRAAAHWVRTQARAVADVLMQIATGAAFPMIAWQWSDEWNSVPVARLRERQRIDPSRSAVRDRWQGVAADCYYDAAADQADAVDRALAAAALVRDQLRDAALATGALYGALCVGTFQCVGILCAAAALSVTGIGCPEGIVAAIGGVADLVALVSTVVVALYGYGFVTARVPDNLKDLFNGGWPSPRPSRFADASLSDGDTTDWRLWT